MQVYTDSPTDSKDVSICSLYDFFPGIDIVMFPALASIGDAGYSGFAFFSRLRGETPGR